MQSTINQAKRGQLIPRVELRNRQRVEDMSIDGSIRNNEPIRAFGDNTLDDTGSWTTNFGNDELKRLQQLQQGLFKFFFPL